MITLNIPVTKITEVKLSDEQMREVAIAYFKKSFHYKMEFIREKNGKSIWYYDDPEHRHGSITEYEFREATETELIYYNAYIALKDEIIQRNKYSNSK